MTITLPSRRIPVPYSPCICWQAPWPIQRMRPEKLRVAPVAAASATAGGENTVRGRVWDIGYLGDVSLYRVRLADGTEMKASIANVTRLIERPIGWDDEVVLSWAPSAAVLLTR